MVLPFVLVESANAGIVSALVGAFFQATDLQK